MSSFVNNKNDFSVGVLRMMAAYLEINHNLLVIVNLCYLQADTIYKIYITYNYSFLIKFCII